MEPIKISSTVPVEKIHHMIEKFPLKKKIKIDYEDYDNRYVYSFSLSKKKINEDIALYNILSDFVQEIILKFYSKRFIRYRVINFLDEVKGLDHNSVIEAVYNIINDKDQFKTEKEYMKEEILNYIIENNTIIIDGYLIFRPASLNYIIDKSIEKVMEDIQLQIEYNEFIYMLQYYVDSQYPKIDFVNVIINEDEFEIRDSLDIPINNDFIKLTLEELFDEDINQSDILLSSLLALIPSKIKIHINCDNQEMLISTLQKIFKERVILCDGCNLCNMDIIENKIDKS